MRMRQVEAFRAVMMSGGVTAAGQILNISQPSVSRLISDLEQTVGFPLFERRSGRVFPTAQANALYDAVRRSFTGLDLLDQAARRIRAHPVGTIRIAALSALAASILPPAIAAFGERYPQIKITVESVGQQAVVDRVFLGQADIGLAVDEPARIGVASTFLADADYVCIAPAGHRFAEMDAIRAADLNGEAFIGPMHEADALWFGIDKMLEQHGVAALRRLETQHSYSAYAFVQAGLGVTIAEPFSAPLFHQLGVVARRFRPKLTVRFALLESEIGPAPPLISEFGEQIIAAAASCLERAEALCQPPKGRISLKSLFSNAT